MTTKVDSASSSTKTTTQTSSGPDKPVAGGTYQVKPHDTLWNLAKEVYGDGSKWKDIADANPGVLERGMPPGTRIKLPPKSQSDQMTTGDPGRDATRILDDGRPKSGGTLPQGDPQLAADMQNSWALANAGGNPGMMGESFPVDRDVKKFETNDGSKNSQNLANWEYSGNKYTTIYSGNNKDGTWRNTTTDPREETKKKAELSSATVTLFNQSGYVSTKPVAGDEVSVSSADGALNASANYKALYADAAGGVSGGIDLKNGTARVDAWGRTGAYLATAEGAASAAYGNDIIGGQTSVKARAMVGAEVTGFASVAFDPKNGDIYGRAGVEAFAGARASAELKQDISIGGMDVGSVGVKGEVYAGIGVKANVEAGFKDGRLQGSFELGACLGVGAGVKVNFDINIAEPVKAVAGAVTDAAKTVGTAVSNAAQAVGSAVSDAAQAVGSAVSNAAETVGNAVSSGVNAVAEGAKSAWNKVTSFFW
ncbi:MAG: LysM peptidoglycan-binding domain-containing protein [Deltaproteobacteria bacterium]|nr:LysM peptidoglycan-binding domain-containing protein [Deltaproteobacteria bacterium]